MSVTLAIGTQIQIASGYGSSKAMSAISNVSAAVATLASSHGVAGGDYIEMTSGWGRLDGRVLRALSVSTNDVTIEGLDTSDTTKYPAGTGTGSVREISGWTTITQLTRQLQVTGGGQNYADISSLDDVLDKRIDRLESGLACRPYRELPQVAITTAGAPTPVLAEASTSPESESISSHALAGSAGALPTRAYL